MTRIVLHDAKGPVEVKIGSESKWICACGLSKNMPYCDGSHKKTHDEESGKTYKYASDGTRTVVK
jgi:CDGSH-type Zn-finger protein